MPLALAKSELSKDRRLRRVDVAAFVAARNPSAPVDEVEIVFCGDLQKSRIAGTPKNNNRDTHYLGATTGTPTICRDGMSNNRDTHLIDRDLQAAKTGICDGRELAQHSAEGPESMRQIASFDGRADDFQQPSTLDPRRTRSIVMY